jgi:hypothetical protein
MNVIRFVFFICGRPFNMKEAKLMVPGVLNVLIDRCILQQVADRVGMKIPQDLVDANVLRIAEANGKTVSDLKRDFANNGISIEVFEKNIRAAAITSEIINSLQNEENGNSLAIVEEGKIIQAGYNSDLKKERYRLLEIYLRIDKDHPLDHVVQVGRYILDLLHSGFDFRILAENMSQGNCSKTPGEMGWQSSGLPAVELAKIRQTSIGSHTGMIVTKTAIKIIYVADKAAPNQAGDSESLFRYMTAELSLGGGLETSSDVAKKESALAKLKLATDPAIAQTILRELGVPFSVRVLAPNDPLTRSILLQSGTHVAFVPTEDPTKVRIVMLVEKVPKAAQEMTAAAANALAVNRRVAKAFEKWSRLAKTQTVVSVSCEHLAMLERQ